jgi:hypothetical protein
MVSNNIPNPLPSTYRHRINEQNEINSFLDRVLGEKKRLPFDKYTKIN